MNAFAALITALALIVLPAAHAATLRGVVQSGGSAQSQPIADAEVALFEATESAPRLIGSARSDAAGRFAIDARRTRSDSVFYLRATLGDGVDLLSVAGPELPAAITVNELSTVAASYAMAQWRRGDGIAGEALALRIAAGMNDNLVDVVTGASSPVLLGSPNADQTNSLRSTRSLANLLAACIADRRVAKQLLALTRAPRGPAPHSTSSALSALARDPGHNVGPIYALTLLRVAYAPALQRAPDAWTLTVKVNDSGDDRVLIGGPGNLAFDHRGIAWVTNNVVQGQTGSSRYVLALRPNGKPADGRNGTPKSPLRGAGILGTGFGVTVDGAGSAWFGNFGWGGIKPEPPANGSVSQFTLSGRPVSVPNGWFGGPFRAQGLATDARGNIWIASFGDNSVYVFPRGDPDRSVGFQQHAGSHPFDVAVAPDGSVWVTNGGGLLGEFPSSVARFVFADGRLLRTLLLPLGQSLKGLAVDSRGNVWVASLGDNTVYGLRPDGTQFGAFSGGGIDGPWDVTIDGDDNLWIANFGPMQVLNNFPDGRLSKLAGANPRGRPPGTHIGDALSPPSGYTAPSAGSQVLLHNGDPLYGADAPPSFAPMMRQTASQIDRAGNVWTVNNYKPDFTVDLSANPGGDGIVIFVGLATPPRAAR